MNLYFVPVLPEESAETVKTSVLDAKKAASWSVPRELPTLSSILDEVPFEESEKRHRFLSFVSEKCKAKGNAAEKVFLDLAIKHGWMPKLVKESEEYDYKHHVDFMLKIKGDQECWVDVKCMRSLRRGWSPQSEYMWVELHNRGWLFGGKATVVAQQIDEQTFALFDRDQLAAYVRKVVNVSLPVVPYAEQSYLRVFVRETKGIHRTITSVLSLVKTADAFEAAGCGILN